MTTSSNDTPKGLPLADLVNALIARSKNEKKQAKKVKAKAKATEGTNGTAQPLRIPQSPQWKATQITILKCIDRCSCGCVHIHCAPSVMLTSEHKRTGRATETISQQVWKSDYPTLPVAMETYSHEVLFCHECYDSFVAAHTTTVLNRNQLELQL